METHKPTKDERDFVKVVKFGTALALGLMAAFLYSLKQVHPHIVIEFGFGTVLSFLITAGFSWVFCDVLFKGEFDQGDTAQAAIVRKRRVTRWVVFFIVVIADGPPSGSASRSASHQWKTGSTDDTRNDTALPQPLGKRTTPDQ